MVAPRKSGSGLSLIPEENSRNMPASSKSTESLYSNTSSLKGSATVLYKRNGAAGRQAGFIPASSDIRQRVLSARRLRIKTFQNQLADAQQHISELAQENRMLRTLHKRQDLALSKYENTNAELPQLLHSHAEEIRVYQLKYRNLQTQYKELQAKLKQKENLILSLSDQNKHLVQLNKDKNLEDRQRLTEKVHQLETRLQEKENEMNLLARRFKLETKNSKKDLAVEQKKKKEALVELEKVKLELSNYVKVEEPSLNDKLSKLSVGSMTNLSSANLGFDDKSNKSTTRLTPLEERHDEKSGDETNRSLGNSFDTNRSLGNSSTTFMNSERITRKIPANKKKTSIHRGEGDGPSQKVLPDFMKCEAARAPAKRDLESSLDSKSEDTNFYDDDDYEDNEDNEEKDEDDADDNEDDNEDDDDDIIKKVPRAPGMKAPKIKNLNSIRKGIDEDFKEREAFLNSFCRQTSSVKPKVNLNRKTELLAALKVIDGIQD